MVYSALMSWRQRLVPIPERLFRLSFVTLSRFARVLVGAAPLEELQARLYLAMADIAGDAGHASRVPDDAAKQLEAWIDEFDEELPPLKDFVIPGASEASAALHLARTICRRAERRVISVGAERALPAIIPAYLNRMSDLLFTMARWTDREAPEGGRTFKERG